VREAPLPAAERATLTDVLLYWFLERFRTLTREEVWAMLNLLTSIEETSGYQAIRDRGRAEGKDEGKAEAKADDLLRLLTRRFGSLPDWARARITAAPLGQLDTWLDGILDAGSLTDLLGPEPPAPAH
jgi:predicted transposase YdaD